MPPGEPIVYRLTEMVADEGRPTTTVAYFTCAAKPIAWAGGIGLKLYDREQEMRLGGAGGDFTPQLPTFRPFDQPGGVIMDRHGRLTPPDQPDASDRPLPAALGVARDVIVPELAPDGAATWRVSRPWVVLERSGPPMLRFQSVQKATGTMTVDYTAGPATGDTVPVTYKTDMTATSDKFSEHLTGDGSFEFDTRRGLVRSVTARLTAEGTAGTTHYSSPVTVDVALLSPDEVATVKEASRKMQADFEAGQKATKAAVANPASGRPRPQDRAWADALELPPGTQRTVFVGGGGGGTPFVTAGDGTRAVIGFRLKIGHWEHAMLGHVEPLYAKPDDLHPAGETVMLAKDGYAVGGLWLNGPDQADALRVIFMRKTAAGSLDPKDAYVGPWFGQVTGPDRVKAGGTGQPVVGVYGRQGMNTDALGVVLRSGNGPAGDPTDDPNFQGTNAPTASRPAPAK